MNDGILLEIHDLKTHFFTDEGVVKAVDGVDFVIKNGKTLCLVGESGCGKSMIARSILQIIDEPGRIVGGQIHFHHPSGRIPDLAALAPESKEIERIRGKEISMIFQEPMSSLSPVHTIGNQISEAILLHLSLDKKKAKARAIEMLRRVGISKPEERYFDYPFQLSGGMRQRAMIAMALSCESMLLIADEPTTALDVTTQATILDLIRELQDELGMAVMFITHDLGVVAEIADDVVVMYLGQVVEQGDVHSIFHEPRHPYTQALLKSIPKLIMDEQERLASIRGMVPHPFNRPRGCLFHPRCEYAIRGICDRIPPPLKPFKNGRNVRCLLYHNIEELKELQMRQGEI